MTLICKAQLKDSRIMSLFRNSYISVYSFFSLTFFWVYSWQSLIVYFILQEETRLKTVCMNASPIDWVQDGQRLITEINALLNWTIHTFTLTMEHYLWNWRLVSSTAGLLEFTNLNRSGIIKFPYYVLHEVIKETGLVYCESIFNLL